METETTLPDWLTSLPPTDDMLPRYPITKDQRELEQMTFLALFERVVEGLEAGNPVSRIVRDDPRQVDLGRFMGWIRRDSTRQSRFDEAKINGMLVLEDKLLEIAEGADSVEDVTRSKLKVDTIKFIMQSWNKRRYGQEKETSHAFTGGINIVIGEVQTPQLTGTTYDG